MLVRFVLILLLSTLSSSLSAQPPAEPSAGTTEQPASPETETMRKAVSFRLTQWFVIHGDGTEATQQQIAQLRNMGCEVQQQNHGNHIDIMYRCPQWKSMTVENDEQMASWYEWLQKAGFDTMLLNPPSDTPMPTVRLRLPEERKLPMRDPGQGQLMADTFSLVGCDAELQTAEGTTELAVSCGEWMTIALPSGQAARLWKDWLDRSGFETEYDASKEGYIAPAGAAHAAGSHGHSHDGSHSHSHDGGR